MECLHWFSSNCDLSESPRSNSYHNLPTLPQDNLKLMYKQISSSMEVTDDVKCIVMFKGDLLSITKKHTTK